MNVVFLNGRMVTAEEARISVFDRGFLYGDGVFETARVQGGRPFRWKAHEARLREGLKVLGFQLPLDSAQTGRAIVELIEANRFETGVLRVAVSRGVGPRGYSPSDAHSPTVVMSLHPRPSETGLTSLRLVTSTVRLLGSDPLLKIKSASKLSHVLARAEADAAKADDALLLNHREEVSAITSGNLFWIDDEVVCTPSLDCGVLPGVARHAVLAIAAMLGLETKEMVATLSTLTAACGVFVTNVVTGVREVRSVDGRDVGRSPVVERLQEKFEEMVRAETTGERKEDCRQVDG